MDVIGRVESGTETESDAGNAYTDVGGRKRQEQVFEPKPKTGVYR